MGIGRWPNSTLPYRTKTWIAEVTPIKSGIPVSGNFKTMGMKNWGQVPFRDGLPRD